MKNTESYPLFHVKHESSHKHYIVVDFVMGRTGYLLLCKPYLEVNACENDGLPEHEIHKQAKDASIPEEVFPANECKFHLFNQMLNYSRISKKMLQRGMVCNDLRIINFPQDHLDIIRAFMEVNTRRFR